MVMKPINPRSGHGIGPSSSDPWYVKLFWLFLVGMVTVAMWIADAWNFILELFKV